MSETLMSNQPKHIAFVDDESDFHVLVKIHLKKEIKENKVKLHSFISGEDCLKFLSENPDKIIYLYSDINMPNMDGFMLTELVKEKYPNIKIVMISAYDSDEYKSKAFDLGACGYLTKPVDFKKVKEFFC